MTDVGPVTAPTTSERDAQDTGRRVRRPRGLPAGRAVVGALLVTAAAVAVFAAYLGATAAPTTRYLVASDTIAPGTRFGSLDDVLAQLSADTLELSPTLAARAIPADEAEALVGQVLLAPLQRGDLVSRTMLVADGGGAAAQTLSFPIARADAVAGTVRPGERIDVLATYASGNDSYTAYVVRGVPLLAVTAPDGGQLGGQGDLTLTVAVGALDDVQALGHAVNTAAVFVTRSTAAAGDTTPAPGAYQPTPTGEGPRPDTAAEQVLADTADRSGDAVPDPADGGTVPDEDGADQGG